MTRKTRKKVREYRFKIDAYTPDTMPLGRLSEYLHDLSVLFGEDRNVHLIRVEGGSTVPVMLVDWEAEPKVRERLTAVKQREGAPEAMRAAAEIDQRLRGDNAQAVIVDPLGKKVLEFLGRERKPALQYGPFSQQGTLDGIPMRIGGELEMVPVHLERMGERHKCLAKRSVAKEIALHLFTAMIRVEGVGKWIRHPEGQWEMASFIINDFRPLRDISIRGAIEELRAIPADWKQLDDPLAELEQIRHGA
jgi:hypothetical protein